MLPRGPLSAAPVLQDPASWNDATTLALVRRAVARRSAEVEQGTLRDYRAAARGFVLFLAQVGEGFPDPPRLVKADQLALEIAWRAPADSKQRIVGWRDRVELPTEISYHRDHLGIVQNEFGDRIRLGDGHEVRDVVHPLSPAGLTRYDFAIADSVRIELPRRSVAVFEVLVRPRRPEAPGVVGSVFLDATDGGIVRFRFSFTRSAYRDATVEDITVALQNGLWEERYWLPQTQEIEIRRRTSWLDFPARGIIRGRWEIDAYRFNVGLPDREFRGPEIVSSPPSVRDTFPWAGSLEDDLAGSDAGVGSVDMSEVRARIGEVVSQRVLSGLPAGGLGAGGVSDYIRFNRVEGLALGAGGVARPWRRLEARAWAGVGLGDERVKARLRLRGTVGGWELEATAARDVRDLSDAPVIAPVLNSFSAQELGKDYGDYYLRDRVGATIRRGLPGSRAWFAAAWERIAPLRVEAAPAHGAFRPNPDLGAGRYRVVAAGFEAGGGRGAGAGAAGTVLDLAVAAEGGAGEGIRYGRLTAEGAMGVGAGVGRLVGRGWIGLGTDDLPIHRGFALGGRGSLVGEPFRSFGGRRAARLAVEWLVTLRVPSVRLGSFASTGNSLAVAPFAAVAWAWSADPASPWPGAPGGRPAVGVSVEWFHRLVRLDLGYGFHRRSFGVAFDLRRDLWPIL